MKPTAALILAATIALTTPAALADEQVRKVQEALKTEGFYYDTPTGRMDPTTTAAIKRYQIRNGLEVTGTMTWETLGALKVVAPLAREEKKPEPPAPAREPKPLPTKPKADEPSDAERDADFLRREPEAPRPPRYDARIGVLPPPTQIPSPVEPPANTYARLFDETPYARAPMSVQRELTRDAQSRLGAAGFYREALDGEPGPATEEAILGFQKKRRLVLTGRLDQTTLAELGLTKAPAEETVTITRRPFTLTLPKPGATPKPIYRGQWVR